MVNPLKSILFKNCISRYGRLGVYHLQHLLKLILDSKNFFCIFTINQKLVLPFRLSISFDYHWLDVDILQLKVKNWVKEKKYILHVLSKKIFPGVGQWSYFSCLTNVFLWFVVPSQHEQVQMQLRSIQWIETGWWILRPSAAQVMWRI